MRRLPFASLWIALAIVVLCGPVPMGHEAGTVSRNEGEARRHESSRLRALGLHAGYNLDHDEALERFREAMAADPADPAPHRLTAATLWIHSLFVNGAVTIEDYLGQVRTSVSRKAPPPELDRAFREHIGRAQALAGERVRTNPNDPDAHFQSGAADSFLASYIGTVEGRSLAALGAARRAFSQHQRVLELDPSRRDAGMVVGSYRYGISTLPLHWRMLAGIAGFRGGRERGLRLLEEAAAYPSDVQTNAQFMLVLVYTRERRYDDALRVVKELQQRYPRNRLLWLEEGSTLLRAGRAGDARTALDAGLVKLSVDVRRRAYGEIARWKYAHAAALVRLGEIAAAESQLREVLAGEAHEWVRGRAHKELGTIADLRGDRAGAAAAYRTALRIARAEDDGECEEEAATLLKSGYRRPQEP